MSRNLVKSPIWATALIVGLVAGTALVAGYVDKPGTNAKVAGIESTCQACPLEGTPQCCKAKGEAGCCKSVCPASQDTECQDGAGCCGDKSGRCTLEAPEANAGCGGGGCSLEQNTSI